MLGFLFERFNKLQHCAASHTAVTSAVIDGFIFSLNTVNMQIFLWSGSTVSESTWQSTCSGAINKQECWRFSWFLLVPCYAPVTCTGWTQNLDILPSLNRHHLLLSQHKGFQTCSNKHNTLIPTFFSCSIIKAQKSHEITINFNFGRSWFFFYFALESVLKFWVKLPERVSKMAVRETVLRIIIFRSVKNERKDTQVSFQSRFKLHTHAQTLLLLNRTR